MSGSASHSQFFSSQDSEHLPTSGLASSGETTKGGNEEVKWEVVAEMAGITLATIVAGRLEGEILSEDLLDENK